MKTIYVSTTKERPGVQRTWYAYNSHNTMGLMDICRDHTDMIGDDLVRIQCTVAKMYAGSHDEWDQHIVACITDSLRRRGFLVGDPLTGMCFLNLK